MDLTQVTSPVDGGFFDAAQPIYERYGEGHAGSPAPKREDVDPPMCKRLADDGRFQEVAVRHWNWDQTYSAADYRKLMLSYSGTQMLSDGDRFGLLDDIEAFIVENFDGRVTRPPVATLTLSVRTAVLSESTWASVLQPLTKRGGALQPPGVDAPA